MEHACVYVKMYYVYYLSKSRDDPRWLR